jgi:hypothetical protein
MRMTTAEELKTSGVKATLHPSLLIESFEGDWEKEWFNYKPGEWTRNTHKLHDERWKAPAGARLALEVLSEAPNKFIVGMDAFAAEINLTGGGAWLPIDLTASDFKDASGAVMADWSKIKELRLAVTDRLVSRKDGKEQISQLGAAWKGPNPKFRNLRWVPMGKEQP